MTSKHPPTKPITHASPERVWETTGRFSPEGKPLWASRAWTKGERAKYCLTVLRRAPFPREA
jgi:hypothetical protein